MSIALQTPDSIRRQKQKDNRLPRVISIGLLVFVITLFLVNVMVSDLFRSIFSGIPVKKLLPVTSIMNVPQGPSPHCSTAAAASVLNMSLTPDLEAHSVLKIVETFHEVLNKIKQEQFSMDDRTIVMCSLKSLIGGYLNFDEYAKNLGKVIGEHPSVSAEARQFVDAALPMLRQKMRLDNLYVDGVSINEEFGVFKHSINPEGHAVVSLFATGMAERMFAIQDDVQAVCQKLIKRTHEAQALNTASTSNQSRTEPHPPGSQLLKSLLFCLNKVSLPTMEVCSMIAHLKCFLAGLLESRKLLRTIEPLSTALAFRFPSLKLVTLPYLLDDAIPALRRAMEFEDVVVDGCNINRELGVFMHAADGAPAWSTSVLMVGNTESRLGIGEEVRNIICSLTDSVVKRPILSPTISSGSSSELNVSGSSSNEHNASGSSSMI
ncbi:hypothetical protein QR680_002738 [Steinernema hermaphroditum]|uniref:Uncharacterized protein n=1 Tax=Steinernema hermaphroditum TaxID=289476 RepID=A0AA39H4S0_9BILA|nr:hypothetical protein QR680_002738 [Steinernema hermaphroditum]